MRLNKPLILASQSPRRAFLLEKIDVSFKIQPAEGDEVFDSTMPITDVPAFLARMKAKEVLTKTANDSIVLGADTVVLFDQKILGKPSNKNEAKEMIARMSGKEHEVVTGVCVMDEMHEETFSCLTKVQLADMTHDEIEQYVEVYKPFDKAGAYGIQDWIGWTKISGISGSYSNVMGLPTHMVYEVLTHWSV